ncbi:hypothetical protein Ancab_039543 [Ancistrocladus abbreviatus]
MSESIISSVVQWIGSQLINEATFPFGVKDQVRSLQADLEYIQLYLRDADQKQALEGEDGPFSLFTKEIREIAFRAEDVIDTYILKVASGDTDDGNILSKCARYFYGSPHVYNVGKEIDAIQSDLRQAFDRLQTFGVTRPAALGEGSSSSNPLSLRPQQDALLTYAHIDDEYVVGLDDDVRNLVRRVTNSSEEESVAAWVVSIVGAGGAGKTTLARRIYNNIEVKNHFDQKVWITISQQWNRGNLLVDLLRQTGGIRDEERNPTQAWCQREIVEKIHHFLSERRYLVVLDDMWATDAWDAICSALPRCRGSKVIITTRNKDLPPHADWNCIIHEPPLLTEEQRWDLLKKIAIDGRHTGVADIARLEELGRDMTRKRGGLPLAIVTLAGLLRTKYRLDEWEYVNRILSSKLLKLKGPAHYGKSVYETFQLSYLDLPYYLKPCFLYLALTPEDAEIPTGMLTRMWIGEGFVTHDPSSDGNESLEDLAEQFLLELIGRCMVQIARRSDSTGKVKSCRLHDLMRDFCMTKAKEQCFLKVFSPTTQSDSAMTISASPQLRRATIHRDGSIPVSSCSNLRSIVQLGKSDLFSNSRGGFLRESTVLLTLRPICENFMLLRVLLLFGIKTNDGCLPEQIGNLRHLRYLGVIDTNIVSLPESIGNLSNLMILEYENVDTMAPECGQLPNALWKMKQLRHLYLPFFSTPTPLSVPETLMLHTLQSLTTLWGIQGGNWMKTQMATLSPCLVKLGIRRISSQEQLDAVFDCPSLKPASRLLHLRLEWVNSAAEMQNTEPFRNNCQYLRKLLLFGKIGDELSLCFPHNLVRLKLLRTQLKLQDPMAAAGKLRHLKVLMLQGESYLGAQMTCDMDSFPQLEVLELECMPNLEEWRVEEGAMPRLKKLIISCDRLRRLPEGLKFINSLQKLHIYMMPFRFCCRVRGEEDIWYQGRARRRRGRDFHIIQHIPNVTFGHVTNKDEHESDYEYI